MYPKNAITPPEVDLGQILLIADGTIQTSGVSVRVKIGTGTWGAGAGTPTCDTTSGIWTYAPTQAETNAAYFIVALYKANCTALSKTVITSASDVSGYSGLDWSKVNAPTTTVALSSTTISNSQVVGSVTGNVGGTVSTVTTLTTLPAIPNNWLTAAGIATGAFTSAKFAAGAFDAVWGVTGRTLTAISNSAGVDTLLTRILGTLTAGMHSPQSGDSFARIGAPAGTSIAADIALMASDANENRDAIINSIPTVDITAIKTKTDNLPIDPADQSLIIAATDSILAAVGTRLATASYVIPPTAVAISTQVNSDLTTAHGTGSYAGPDISALATSSELATVKTVATRLNTMLVLDGSVYQYTANALELGPAGGGGGGGSGTATIENQTLILNAVNGLYAVPITVEHSSKPNTLIVYHGEQVTRTFNTADHTARNIKLVIETPKGADISVIPNNELTKTSTTVTFPVPSGVYSVDNGSFSCCLRDTTTDEKLESINIEVRYAPL